MTKRRKLVARGRTANISESGVYMIAECLNGLPRAAQLLLELTVPDYTRRTGRGRNTRTVRYTCQVVRTEPLGQLYGLAVHFIRKRS